MFVISSAFVAANIHFCLAAVILVFITMIFMSPELCKRHTSNEKISSVLAWSSVVSSALAFLFLIGIYSVAKYRFQKNGFTVSVGNMVREKKKKPSRRSSNEFYLRYQARDVASGDLLTASGRCQPIFPHSTSGSIVSLT